MKNEENVKKLGDNIREPLSDITHLNANMPENKPKEEKETKEEKKVTAEIEIFDFSHKNFEEKLGKRKAWETENFYGHVFTASKRLKPSTLSQEEGPETPQNNPESPKKNIGPSTLETVSNNREGNFILQNTELALMDPADQNTDTNSISGKGTPTKKRRTIEHLFYSPIAVRKLSDSEKKVKGTRIFS